MTKIFEIKSQITTNQFNLGYDTAKDKYYLDICAYGDLWTETFYGSYALKEYLRTDWDFTEGQIAALMTGIYDVA